MNQVNISNAIQIILTKFAVTVTRLQLLIFLKKTSTLVESLISVGIMFHTFEAKYLDNDFKPNVIVLTLN